MTDWAQIFTGFLFYADVEIQQVIRLVFENYQWCPVSLSNENRLKEGTRLVITQNNMNLKTDLVTSLGELLIV